MPTSPPSDDASDPAGRYEDRFLVGQGGMGDVRLVYDRRLRRTAVMKVVRAELAGTRAAARLVAEAEITARLQHPGVVPVYDAGRLADGRPFYVMREVRGRTLAEVVASVHGASRPGEWVADTEGWTFRRVVDAFLRACETVAYAHEHGVVHRDLKPSNVMLEGFGAVVVLDWGIAKLVRPGGAPARAPAASATLPTGSDTLALEEEEAEPAPVGLDLTRAGTVLGTPGYMAPEQAAGAADVGPAADVHALGATLHTVLYGTPPGSAPRVDPRVPDALARLAAQARARVPSDRPTASALAREVAAWLDGVRRREEALELVGRADAVAPRIAELRARAAGLRTDARRALAALPPHAPAEAKVPAWRLDEEADGLLQQVVVHEEEWTQLLHGALELVPDLAEAHARLADHYQHRHASALDARDRAAATTAEMRLRVHDRGRHAAWLAGDGTLTLDTDPSGVEITLSRYVLRDRRLVPEGVGSLGRTPLRRVRVPSGSLLLHVAGPGGVAAVPIFVRRGEAWALASPEGARPLRLPRPGELGPDDCWVPAGWVGVGGDPVAVDPLPAARWWTDGLVVRGFPVSNAEYLAFLDDLARVDAAAARARVPRRAEGMEREEGEPFFAPGPDGRHVPTAHGADWHPDEPVTFVTWHDACAYATWRAEKDGLPWRLPHEIEWEMAARGPDGRALPWGDFLEPSWANTLETRPGPRRERLDSFPRDASPYGVRGLAGNVRDWCGNAWRKDGEAPTDGRVPREPFDPAAPDLVVALRGGAFHSSRALCYLATRFGSPPSRRFGVCGFRLVRDFP